MATYSRALRLEILSAWDTGESAALLQARYGVSIGTLRNWRDLRDDTGDVAPRPHGGGRARILDDAGTALLVELRLQHPEESCAALAARLGKVGIAVSDDVVRLSLRAAGFVRHAVKSSAKPALSKRPRSTSRRYQRPAPPPDLAHRRAYSSDLTDAEWDLLDPLVPAAKTVGRPAEHSRREIVNAIFYVLRSGCQWEMLPHDFPPWKTVYDYFRRWRDGGIWETVNQTLREKVRQRAGREKTPSAVIIDSQSVKTTERGGPEDFAAQSA